MPCEHLTKSVASCDDEPALSFVIAQIPTIGFLYVAGYIGYVGRQYIMAVKKAAKPIEKEIIIDVPLAIKLAWQGAGWPLATIQVGLHSHRHDPGQQMGQGRCP